MPKTNHLKVSGQGLTPGHSSDLSHFSDNTISLFFFVFISFCLCQGCTHGIRRFPGQGSSQSCSRRPTPQLQQNNTISLTQCTTGKLLVTLFFLLFRAAPEARRDSQARGLIRATAASLHHSHSNSNARSEPSLQSVPLSRSLTH